MAGIQAHKLLLFHAAAVREQPGDLGTLRAARETAARAARSRMKAFQLGTCRGQHLTSISRVRIINTQYWYYQQHQASASSPGTAVYRHVVAMLWHVASPPASRGAATPERTPQMATRARRLMKRARARRRLHPAAETHRQPDSALLPTDATPARVHLFSGDSKTKTKKGGRGGWGAGAGAPHARRER
jgi:hypothetical protein